MLSTGSAGMKLFFGAKPGSFFIRSTFWIAASSEQTLSGVGREER
jgi:hypothetical protein